MDVPKEKYEKIWKIFQRMHNGLNQCNQITHSEHLCVWLLAKSRAHQRKKICSSWIRAHTELTSRASVTLLTQQMCDILRKTLALTSENVDLKPHSITYSPCATDRTPRGPRCRMSGRKIYIQDTARQVGRNIYRDWRTISLNNCYCHHFLLEFCNPRRAVSSPIKCKIRDDKGEVGRY